MRPHNNHPDPTTAPEVPEYVVVRRDDLDAERLLAAVMVATPEGRRIATGLVLAVLTALLGGGIVVGACLAKWLL